MQILTANPETIALVSAKNTRKVVILIILLLCICMKHIHTLLITALLLVASPIFSLRADAFGAGTMRLEPGSMTVNEGDFFSVIVMVDTAGSSLTSAQAVLNYDSSIIEVAAIDINPSGAFEASVAPTWDTTSITLTASNAFPRVSDGELGIIHFKAKSFGLSSVMFNGSSELIDFENSNILVNPTGGTYTVNQVVQNSNNESGTTTNSNNSAGGTSSSSGNPTNESSSTNNSTDTSSPTNTSTSEASNSTTSVDASQSPTQNSSNVDNNSNGKITAGNNNEGGIGVNSSIFIGAGLVLAFGGAMFGLGSRISAIKKVPKKKTGETFETALQGNSATTVANKPTESNPTTNTKAKPNVKPKKPEPKKIHQKRLRYKVPRALHLWGHLAKHRLWAQ